MDYSKKREKTAEKVRIKFRRHCYPATRKAPSMPHENMCLKNIEYLSPGAPVDRALNRLIVLDSLFLSIIAINA